MPAIRAGGGGGEGLLRRQMAEGVQDGVQPFDAVDDGGGGLGGGGLAGAVQRQKLGGGGLGKVGDFGHRILPLAAIVSRVPITDPADCPQASIRRLRDSSYITRWIAPPVALAQSVASSAMT